MDVEIRTLGPDEFERYFRALDAAFGGHGRPEDLERERKITEIDRCLVAVDGTEMVGGASAATFHMSIPGGEAPTAGVTGVAVRPTHRRRGVTSAMMRRQLDDIHARGEPLAALFASEGGIYGRFGYGLASFACSIDVERQRTGFVRGYEPRGRTWMLERDAALEAFLAVYDRARHQRPGMMAMGARWFEHRFAETHWGEDRKWFYVAHEEGGDVDAYAVYQIKHEWTGTGPANELGVEELQALSPQAYADMWRYCFDVDLIHRITAWNRPADEPLLHLVQEPRRLQFQVRDGLWVRLVDVPAALEARRYAADGRVVLEVRDPFCPWNEGRFALDGGPEGASCRPTAEEPDLFVSATDLGAVYLGGTSLRRLHWAGRVQEERPGVLDSADSMFGWDPSPWSSFVF